MNRRRVVAAAAVLVMGVAVAGCSSGTTTAEPSVAASADGPTFAPERQAAMQQVLDDARTKFDFPGAQAGVWTEDGTWIGVAGTSGRDTDRAPQRDDHTRIGSITKTFTVALVLQLADQGRVDLDDVIDTYVPGMPNGDSATLRQLASMTSGIPPYSFDKKFLSIYFADPYTVFSPQELVDFVKDDKPSFPAGTAVEYSNTNTVLLGMVIEKVTGEPFAETLRAGLLEPLGLTQTSFPFQSAELPQPHLDGITTQTDPEGTIKDATDFNPSWGFTAGAMISTLDDLHRWSVALGTGEGWISPELQEQRTASMTSDLPENTKERAYALGFGVENGWIGHTGELPGYNSSIQFDPQTRTSVVVMVNSDIPAGKDNPAPYITAGLKEVLASTP